MLANVPGKPSLCCFVRLARFPAVIKISLLSPAEPTIVETMYCPVARGTDRNKVVEGCPCYLDPGAGGKRQEVMKVQYSLRPWVRPRGIHPAQIADRSRARTRKKLAPQPRIALDRNVRFLDLAALQKSALHYVVDNRVGIIEDIT